MTFGSLFSGIGGMDLGLCRAGMTPVWHSEIDPYASRVLARHWPGVPNLGDIARIDWAGVERPDLVCGGFPCQDISFAGKGAGLAGKRSGLWYEFARCVREVRPRYVLVENVAALLVRGIGAVLGTLASFGYDAEWSIVSACSLGAPHTRERVFIVAYPYGELRETGMGPVQAQLARLQRGDASSVQGDWVAAVARNAGSADGISDWMDRCRVIGNSVVPQVAEFIGRRLMEAAA